MGTDHGDVLARWEVSMRAEGLAERTVSERLRIVRASGVDPLTVDLGELEGWLAAGRGWAPGTRRAYVDAMRAALGWVQLRGFRSDDPTAGLPVVRVPKGRPRPVTTADLGLLVERARRSRLRGYVLLASYGGLRVSEVAAVRGEDVHGRWLSLTGKGDRRGRVGLHPVLLELAAGMPATGWWFPSYTRPGPVSGNNVSRVLGDHMRRCGVPGTPHALRHWYGSTLVDRGVQMRVVQEAMRHESLTSTQIYTEVTDDQVLAAVDRLPGLQGEGEAA